MVIMVCEYTSQYSRIFEKSRKNLVFPEKLDFLAKIHILNHETFSRDSLLPLCEGFSHLSPMQPTDIQPGITPIQMVLRMTLRHRPTLLVMLSAVVVASVLDPIDNYLMKLIIDALSHGPSMLPRVLTLFGIFIGVSFFTPFIWRMTGFLGIRMIPLVRKETRLNVFEYLQKHSHRYFSDHFAGSLANKVSTIGRATGDILADFFWIYFVTVITFVTSLAFLVMVNVTIAACIFLASLVYVAIFFFYSKQSAILGKAHADARSVSHGVIVDSLSNVWNAMSFARHAYEHANVADHIDLEVIADRNSWRYSEILRAIQSIVFNCATALVLFMAILLWSRGQATVGDIVLVFSLSSGTLRSVRDLSRAMLRTQEQFGDMQDAIDIIVRPYDIVDRPDAQLLTVPSGHIHFENVSFVYKNGRHVFDHLSLDIPAGQKIGLVGRSGAGKSTLVVLLQRFYECTGGRILVDGQDISQVTMDSLREHISVVPQDPALFHRSLRDNISYGRANATENEILEATRQAYADEFIEHLPEQYESKVGERGIKLSGGQRQRVAIARAILKAAPILILDEATSALDSESEHYIQEALNTLMQGRTTLVIAHRLSTLSRLDRIIVFDKGSVIEDGTHAELLARGGVYAGLWSRQAGGFIA